MKYEGDIWTLVKVEPLFSQSHHVTIFLVLIHF